VPERIKAVGKCILGFDQTHIVYKKSDSNHSDNDWIIVSWFVGKDLVRTDTLPLLKADGSPVLETGSLVRPFSLEVDCGDTDLVTASFVVVNLGSTDFSEQVNEAGQIGAKISEKLAELYLKAAELVVRSSGLPLAQVFADGIEELAPVIRDSVGAAWEDVIVPVVNEVVQFFQVLFGRPNCNGEVFHDLVLFKPFAPATPETWSQHYKAWSVSGCGTPAETHVVYTRERLRDMVPQFPNTPPPKTEASPSQNESPALWTPTPLITVVISRSAAALGTFAVEIVEHVDRRFGATFLGGGDGLLPQRQAVEIFGGNTFGAIKPWYSHVSQPGDLQMVLAAPGIRPTQDRHRGSPTPTTSLRLAWERPRTLTAAVELFSFQGKEKASPAEAGLGGGVMFGLVEQMEVIALPAQGVRLCLYTITAAGQPIAHAVRYIRAESALYTRADVMLGPWTPVA
jgi:hypothetical protein